jgi:DNA (cytosine-5)-methyltransferase 1
VTTYDFREGEADAISAGFPCQDISFAGNGAGLAGERSGLYREVIRALRVVRPRVAILENVAALLSRGLDVVLRDLAEVGYDAEWHCIPASAVGAPHRRDRIWIIAHARGQQHEGRSLTFSGALAEELLAKDTDAASERRGEAGQLRYVESPEWSPGLCEDVADAESGGQQGSGDVQGEIRQAGQPIGSTWWAVEPDVGRVAHGVPARVDRLTRLGNSVVPQIPEIIGRAIMKASTLSPSHQPVTKADQP